MLLSILFLVFILVFVIIIIWVIGSAGKNGTTIDRYYKKW